MSAVFLIACVALSVTPGPGVLFVVSRTLAFGRRAGFVSVAAISDSVYVLAATAVASRLRPGHAARRVGRTATAALYIGLGAFAAASGTRDAR